MDLLLIPVPLFDRDMIVQAYLLRYQEGTDLMIAHQTVSQYDGAALSPLLETLNQVGTQAFTIDQPLFVPVSGLMLLAGLERQCSQPPNRIVFVVGSDVTTEKVYLDNIRDLRQKGFRFALRKIADLRTSTPLLRLADYIMLDMATLEEDSLRVILQQLSWHFGHLRIVAENVVAMERYTALQSRGISLFEGPFYRRPLNRGQTDISPLKVNLIHLLNIVRDDNFEFSVVADIVRRDTALSLSLMRMVNSPFLGLSQKIKTINHAVTILGQLEVRKWVTTSVSRSLGSDQPNEITKLSLVRAKFMENLSRVFDMRGDSQSLFLMGLFSVLDVVLEIPMEKALQLVSVSDDIHAALLNGTGRYAPVQELALCYEMADWPAVSRILIVRDLQVKDVAGAYIYAAAWYSQLIRDELKPFDDSEWDPHYDPAAVASLAEDRK